MIDHETRSAPRGRRLRVAFLAIGLTACGSSTDTPPGPQIFAPGAVSTELLEFAVTFTPDATTAYFNRTTADRSSLAIMVSRWDGQSWSGAEAAPFSGEHFDVDPFVTPDGSRLYFSSTRPTAPGDTLPDFNTWYVDIDTEGAADPQLLPEPFNTDASEIFVSATDEGVLYFGSDRDGTSRTYRAVPANRGGTIEVVDIDMNLSDGVGNPLVSPDERFLLFAASATTGAGESDIYVSYRTADGWTPAEMVGGDVNSAFTDFAPALGPDGEYLYFTSERPWIAQPVEPGVRPPGDVYRISLESAGIR